MAVFPFLGHVDSLFLGALGKLVANLNFQVMAPMRDRQRITKFHSIEDHLLEQIQVSALCSGDRNPTWEPSQSAALGADGRHKSGCALLSRL